jgi:hypothetical protein
LIQHSRNALFRHISTLAFLFATKRKRSEKCQDFALAVGDVSGGKLQKFFNTQKKKENITYEESWSLNTNKNHNKYWERKKKISSRISRERQNSNCVAKIRKRERGWEPKHMWYQSQKMKILFKKIIAIKHRKSHASSHWVTNTSKA